MLFSWLLPDFRGTIFFCMASNMPVMSKNFWEGGRRKAEFGNRKSEIRTAFPVISFDAILFLFPGWMTCPRVAYWLSATEPVVASQSRGLLLCPAQCEAVAGHWRYRSR